MSSQKHAWNPSGDVLPGFRCGRRGSWEHQVVYFLQRGLYCVKYYGLLWGIVAAEKKMKGVKKNYQGKKKKFH